MRLGFVGVGNMGGPMAANVLRAGHELKVTDLRREAAAELIANGATWVDSPAEAAEGSEAVLLSLPKPPDVEKVVLGERGVLAGAAPGSTIIDLSTNSPTVMRRIHACPIPVILGIIAHCVEPGTCHRGAYPAH